MIFFLLEPWSSRLAPRNEHRDALFVIGRHCQNRSSRHELAASTRVERSSGLGTYSVHHALKPCRAITLCCTANSDIKSRLTTTDWIKEEFAPVSMVFGTATPITKAMA